MHEEQQQSTGGAMGLSRFQAILYYYSQGYSGIRFSSYQGYTERLNYITKSAGQFSAHMYKCTLE